MATGATVGITAATDLAERNRRTGGAEDEAAAAGCGSG
jgi:hypothetical protein